MLLIFFIKLMLLECVFIKLRLLGCVCKEFKFFGIFFKYKYGHER